VFLFTLFGSIAAMITTLPVVVAAFGTLSLIAPLTNLLISFAVSVALTSTVLALALFPVPIFRYAAAPLFWVSGLLTRYINRVILWCGGADLTVYIPKSAFVFTFLPIIAILCVILGCNRRKYLLKLKKLENERGGSNGRAVRGCR
ncbi:MAG: ComEC/Rec2 family competence protein, partial [Clostridia bacterium]|nr:ComEC/Rec2 family competence protein [Clostridia bacterium]